MVEKKMKQQTIVVLSDSEEDDESIADDDEEEDYEEEEDTSNPTSSDDVESECESELGSEAEEEEEADLESIEEDENDNNSDESDLPVDEQSRCERVHDYLKGGRDLELLKLDECKAYLRKYGLRITGAKTVLIQRIQEHWRIKDGTGEKLYPRPSFSINCTGDVCKGDVVLFTQRVYEKFDKMKRRGDPRGKRTVAGRVVKESYGAAKQQHTFTVEVLWSKGLKKLPPLFPLLVKGRNLYRMRTFRQRWSNEAERSQVLAEKHSRGAAARNVRAMKKARSGIGGSKRGTRSSESTMGRREKGSELPRKRRRKEEPKPTTRSETKNDDSGRGKTKPKNIKKQGVAKSSARQLVLPGRPNENEGLPRQAFSHPPLHHHYGAQIQFPPRDAAAYYEVGSASTRYTDPTMTMPEFQHHGYNHHNYMQQSYRLPPGYGLDPRNAHHFPNHMQLNSVAPFGVDMKRAFRIQCSTPGCGDERGENCVMFSCWRCCRRTGRRCPRHPP